MEEVNHPNRHPEADPRSALDEKPAVGRHDEDEGRATCYTVATTAGPTVRLHQRGITAPAPTGAVRSGSIRVGVLPKSERLLRTPALIFSADSGWTRPVAVKPFVTHSFSGLRIRAGGESLP